MKQKIRLAVFACILILTFLIAFISIILLPKKSTVPQIFVGVDIGFGGENDVYKVADAVSGFANLIIIGTSNVTRNTPELIRVCNYLYDKGLSFIIYVGFGRGTQYPPDGPAQDFFNTTVKQWGDKFLGAYIFDEVGGKQLDYAPGTQHYSDKPVKNATNYSDAAQQFIHVLNNALESYTGPSYYNVPSLKTFNSDYGLYWFDYLFGYNVVFAEFAGNHSRQLAIALCRGAANVNHMEWGTMITWKYDHAPFLEEADQLYGDMVLAYENGAKYIMVFNSPENQTTTTELGTLTTKHLDAMRRFWNYASTHVVPTIPTEHPVDTAYVLPRDYGFGFRGPNDTIWGLWDADNLAPKIWNDITSLVAQYGSRLDIVYETLTDNLPARLMYDKLIFWNSTIIGRSGY